MGDLDQHVAALDGQVDVARRDADRSNQRIDTVLTRTRAADVGGVGGVRVVDRQFVDVIGNMRTSILAAATPAQRAKVNAALAESEDGGTGRARDAARRAHDRADLDDHRR